MRSSGGCDGVAALHAVLALMETCRTVYAEVGELFYGDAVFQVFNPFVCCSPAVLQLLRVVAARRAETRAGQCSFHAIKAECRY
jgi:hypothetical protein